jgi:hypothetical protein
MGVSFAIIALVVILFVSAVAAWFYRGLLMSLIVRLLASALPNAAKRHGLAIRFGAHQGGWIRLTLKANLGKTLCQVAGRPVEAAAYSHFGGFNLNHVYSDFMNPDSVYYQAWLGAYVVFDDEERQAFGFDKHGGFIPEEILAVLEADQRLVYHSTGCLRKFPNGNLVRLTSELTGDQAEVDGLSWWRISGEAETWSVYHQGMSPGGSFRSRVYGIVPSSAEHDVDDFHPLRYRGEFWVRYFPEYEATCARFYIYPYYKDKHGREVTKGEAIVAECEEVLTSITFSKQQ